MESRNKLIVPFQEPDRAAILRLIDKIHSERLMMMQKHESMQLAMAVRQAIKVPGDLIEVGVFQGGRSRLILAFARRHTLHLCDTLEGLPEPNHLDVQSGFAKGGYNCSLENVQEYLKSYPNPRFYKGFFPQSAAGARSSTRFCFAHLDVDLYESTIQSLEFL